MANNKDTWPGRVDSALVLLFLSCCFLLTRPYLGIFHDGVLYALEALHQSGETQLAADMIIRLGGQGHYTIYIKLWATLIGVFGLASATLVLCLAGLAAWLGALFWLGRVLWRAGALGDRRVLFAVALAVILLPSGYGGFAVFHYGEAIATPRTFAEALIFCAVALALKKQPAGAMLLVVLGALLHPIIATGGAVLVWLLLVFEDRRYLWLLPLAGGLFAVAAVLQLGPFGDLLRPAQPAWFEIARIRNPYAFPSLWLARDWLRLAFDLSLTAVLIWRATGMLRRLAIAVVITALVGLLITLIGVEIFHNAFLMRAQPWRAVGLLHLFGAVAVAVLVMQMLRQGELDWLVIALLLFASASFATPYVAGTLLMMAIMLAIFLLAQSGGDRVLKFESYRLIAIFSGLLAVGAMFIHARALYSAHIAALPLYLEHWTVFKILHELNLSWLILGLVAVGIYLARRHRWLTGGLVTVVALTTILLWDQRGLEARHYDGSWKSPVPFAGKLKRNDLLYWPEHEATAWLLARRPLFMNAAHGAAAVLFEAQALEYRRRAPIVAAFGGRILAYPGIERIIGWPISRPNGWAALSKMCRRAPGLDKVVLSRELAGAKVSWRASFVRDRDILSGDPTVAVRRTYYLYDCGKLRSQ